MVHLEEVVRSADVAEAHPVLFGGPVERCGARVVEPIERLNEGVRRPGQDVRISDEVDSYEVRDIPCSRDVCPGGVGVGRVYDNPTLVVQPGGPEDLPVPDSCGRLEIPSE